MTEKIRGATQSLNKALASLKQVMLGYKRNMAEDFKPNIYPIMYWGLMYGLIAGFLLFILFILSQYLNLLWFPVFLAGVVWGGYRNYKKQKRESGQASEPKPAIEEFKEAARDIVGATKEMVSEQLQEAAAKDAAEQEAMVSSEEEQEEIMADTILEEGAEQAPEVTREEQMPAQPEDVIPPPPVQPEQTDKQKPEQGPPVI